MKSSAKNVTLTSVDDLFTTEEEREEKKREKVQNIPLSELHPFRDHPFKVVDDDKMLETVESIREYGVLVPIIARPKEDGGYEIISGHRRCHASEKAGLETIPTIVRDLDDEAILDKEAQQRKQRKEQQEERMKTDPTYAAMMKERKAEYTRRRTANRHGKYQELIELAKTDEAAAQELAAIRAYHSRATVKSYQKMKADAEAGDPDAIRRYEATLAMRRESYYKKKWEREEALTVNA